MLVLSSLTALLSQLVAPPALHTAILLTPQGHLVAYSSRANPVLSEDTVQIVVGLSGEIWREGIKEGNEEDIGMAECDLGRILVVPIYPPNRSTDTENAEASASTQRRPRPEPLLLIAIHATAEGSWGLMRIKATTLANYLAEPISVVRSRLGASSATPSLTRAAGVRTYS